MKKMKLAKKSVFRRMFLFAFISSAVILSMLMVYSDGLIRQSYLDNVKHDLTDISILTGKLAVPYLEQNRGQDLLSAIGPLGKELNARLTVISTNGTVLADSMADPSKMENHAYREEVKDALLGKIGNSTHLSKTLGDNRVYVAAPIFSSGKIIGAIRSSRAVDEINDILNQLQEKLLLAGAAFILLLLISDFFISRRVLMPLQNLVAAAQLVEKGDFTARVYLKEEDEFKEIADRFNGMVESIGALFQETKAQKQKLEALVQSLNEGLCVLDLNGKITLCNMKFEEFFQGEAVGQYYWAVFRDRNFADMVESLKRSRKNISAECIHNGRSYYLLGSPVPSTGESVIILHDITGMKELEQIKKDFVANVSHELRTPLTAIKGYVETLEDEIGEDQKHYLNIISRHTERLILIVRDLLLLSELENNPDAVRKESVSIKNVVEDTITLFEQKAKVKNIAIQQEWNIADPSVPGDSYLISQALINLLDNAIKYTERGEVIIRISSSHNELNISVEDTGPGIPEKDLPRIFDRFYVVDKSRSRSLGGTGLGLSIVKHIALLHGGSVKAESVMGKGSRFVVTLPKPA